MTKVLSKPEAALLLVVIAVLVWISWQQHNRLQTIQTEQRKVHYAVRLRAAQAMIETEMLRSVYFTTSDEPTRQLARRYLESEIK